MPNHKSRSDRRANRKAERRANRMGPDAHVRAYDIIQRRRLALRLEEFQIGLGQCNPELVLMMPNAPRAAIEAAEYFLRTEGQFSDAKMAQYRAALPAAQAELEAAAADLPPQAAQMFGEPNTWSYDQVEANEQGWGPIAARWINAASALWTLQGLISQGDALRAGRLAYGGPFAWGSK